MVSDKMIHKALRIHKQNPLEIFFSHYLPKLYFGFKEEK